MSPEDQAQGADELREKEPDAAPIYYSACEAGAWAAGYNSALPEIERLTAKHEADLDDALKERDRCEEWADALAYTIAPVELIGEHSSTNCPWENAVLLHDRPPSVDEMASMVRRYDEARAEIERLTVLLDAKTELIAALDAEAGVEELVAVMLPRPAVKAYARFPDGHVLLADACRAALDAEASR